MKAVKPATPATPNTEATGRILKIGSCPTLTGKATLTYHIGCTDKSEVQFRVYASTGGGFFNNDWVPLNSIQQAFDKCPPSKPLTSHVLIPLFRGQSSNTPGFLLAALKQEGLVQPVKDKLRCYERVDPKGFISEVKALIKSSVDLKVEEKPLKPAGGKSKPVAPRKETPSKSTAKKK